MTSMVQALSDSVVITKRNLIKVKRVPDLIVFATSDRYTDLRQRIGIQVSSLGSTGG